MSLLIIISGIVLLFILITVIKIDAFISFMLVCIFVGLTMGLSLDSTVNAIQKGIGDTLGFLVLILGFGAMLGKIVAQSGAAIKISESLIRLFGIRKVQIALMLTGFIVGVPMFFNVGFIILVPIVFTIADAIGLPLLYLAAPMIASLSVTHGFLPPHPSPSAIAGIFHADMGKIMLYGTIIAIPTILLAGPALSFLYRRFKARPLDEFLNKNNNKNIHLPSATISVIIALMPVFLIGLGGLGNLLFQKDQLWFNLFNGIGNPVIAMFISVLFAIYFLEFRYGKKIKQTMEDLARSISGIAMIFLIIAGAGALKEILVQTHLSEYLGALFSKADISPLVLGWVIAAVIRIAIGSATVAGLTAAGIVLPLISSSSVSPELMVLSIGAGSLIMSHVNDSGFWLFKEYFGLTVKETLCTWSVMETVISLIGLAGVMVLNIFI